MWPRKHKHLNEIQKSIQDMKLELKKKEIEIMKKNQTEMMLEMKVSNQSNVKLRGKPYQ